MSVGRVEEIENGGEVRMVYDAESRAKIPEIVLEPGESPKAVDEAEQILLKHAEKLKLFQRGGELVRVISLPEARQTGLIRRPVGTVQLIPVGAAALLEVFDRTAKWFRQSEDGARRVDCPKKIATSYLSRVGHWRLPVLKGIVTSPLLREDGTILHRAGFDAETGLFLTEEWSEIASTPSRDDALKSLDTLLAPFQEFPFLGAEDRSVIVAAVLTVLQRRLLASAPIFGFTAPSQRTGKSLLAECTALIGTGRPAPAMAVSGDKEEIRKAVASALREGHVIINLDNIEHALGSPDLSRAITQEEYADRVLGESRLLRLPTNLMWTATGNNLTFRGDLVSRAVLCRLDARMEHPEKRRFKIPNLKAYVLDHRYELVTAAITILRAFIVAGTPTLGIEPWGGFEEWGSTIRCALVWLGLEDPCASRKHVIEEDPDREQAAALLRAWRGVFKGEPVAISKIIEAAESNSSVKEALLAVAASKGVQGKLDPRRLGWWAREYRGRVLNGLRLEKVGTKSNYGLWLVEEMEAQAPDDPGYSDESFSGHSDSRKGTRERHRPKNDSAYSPRLLGCEEEGEL